MSHSRGYHCKRARILVSLSMVVCLVLCGALAAAEDPQFVISTYAGGPPATIPIAGVNAAIDSPQGIVADGLGNVYFASLYAYYDADSDDYHGRYGVFKLDPSGSLTRIAGNWGEGYSGDGGPAINAQFRLSQGTPGVGVDAAGNVYVADSGNNRVRKLWSTGIITTVAGNGTSGNSGDGGPAIGAQLLYPSGLAVSSAGVVYIASGDRIRKVSPDGNITTAAMATAGSAIALDGPGNLYIADDSSVRKVSPSGTIITIAAESGHAIAVDGSNNIYLGEVGRVRKIAPDGGITTVAGNGTCGYYGDGGPATKASLCINGLASNGQGNLYIADVLAERVRVIYPSGVISTVAGNGRCCFSGDGGPALGAQLSLAPWGGGLAVDMGSNLYIPDAANNRVRKVSPSGTITTVAGDGAAGAQLSYPSTVAVDSVGNLYIADTGYERILKISPSGNVNQIVQSIGRVLAIDKADNLYFVDGGGVHKIAPSGTLTTLTATPLNVAFAAVVDDAGNFYAAEIGGKNYRVRKIAPDGIVTTVAGDGTEGYSGDGGPATSAQLNGPSGLALDRAGNLYIADSFNGRIRMVSPAGIITTVAGNGGSGYSGDGGPAAGAQLGSLSGLAIDSRGNLYAADQSYNAVRLLQRVVPPVVLTGAINAASNLPGAVAPGELVVFTGSGLGPEQLVSATPGNDGYPAQLAATSVSVNGIPASLIYSSATQVAATIPDLVATGTAQVTLTYQGQSSSPLAVQVAPFAPGIFTVGSTGWGHAVTVDQNGLINTPVAGGDVIRLFLTGTGHATSGSVYGRTYQILPLLDGTRSASGVTMIKVPIPEGADCDTPVTVQVGDVSSQEGVTIAVKICI